MRDNDARTRAREEATYLKLNNDDRAARVRVHGGHPVAGAFFPDVVSPRGCRDQGEDGQQAKGQETSQHRFISPLAIRHPHSSGIAASR